MSHKDKKGKQSTHNPEDEVQDKSSRIIKRYHSRLLSVSRDVAYPDSIPKRRRRTQLVCRSYVFNKLL